MESTIKSGAVKARSPITARHGAIFVAGGMVLFFAFAMIVFRWSAVSALAAILFQLLCVAAPGIALTKLFKIALTPLESLCIAYGFGFAVNVLVYFPLGLMRRTEFIPFAMAAVAVLSLAALFFLRKRPLSKRADRGELAIALIAAFFTAAITLGAFGAGFLDPALSGLHHYYHDSLNAVSLTASAKLGYPFHFLQMAGVTYWYHPFTYFYTANISLCTGISAFDVTTKLLIMTVTPFAMSTMVAIAMRVTGKKWATFAATVLCCIFPASGIYYYLFEDLLGFMPGVAFGALSVLVLLEAQSISRRINGMHILSAVFMIMCLGAKGPVAVSIIFGICFALLMQLITEKDLWVFPKGLCYAVPFFFFYWYLYGTAVDESMSVSPAYSAIRSDFGVMLGEHMVWGSTGHRIISSIHYSTTFIPLITAALIIGIILMAKTRCKDTFINFTTSGTLLGLVFINVFKQMGSSEWYFVFCMYWFCAVLFVEFIRRVWEDTHGKKILPAILTALALVIWLCSCTLTVSYFKAGIQNAITYSYYSPTKMDTEEEMNAFFRRGASLSPEEYEGYIFMRDNLPDTAVICDYRYKDYNKCFFGCAFSEKMFLLEGWGYVTMEDTNDNKYEKGQRDLLIGSFYGQQDEGFIPMLKQYGATHIVITEYFTPGWELSGAYTNLVFQNDSIRIYEIA